MRIHVAAMPATAQEMRPIQSSAGMVDGLKLRPKSAELRSLSCMDPRAPLSREDPARTPPMAVTIGTSMSFHSSAPFWISETHLAAMRGCTNRARASSPPTLGTGRKSAGRDPAPP